MKKHYSYPAVFSEQPDKTIHVSFPSVPEAQTDGHSIAEASINAVDALDEALAARIEDKEEIPKPSREDRNNIELPVHTSMKVALYEAMLSQKVSNVELAKCLGVDEKAVRRFLDPRHNTKVEALEKALRHLGVKASVRFSKI